MKSGLKGKVILITGAGSGIGGQRRWRLPAKQPIWRCSVQIYHLSK